MKQDYLSFNIPNSLKFQTLTERLQHKMTASLILQPKVVEKLEL